MLEAIALCEEISKRKLIGNYEETNRIATTSGGSATLENSRDTIRPENFATVCEKFWKKFIAHSVSARLLRLAAPRKCQLFHHVGLMSKGSYDDREILRSRTLRNRASHLFRLWACFLGNPTLHRNLFLGKNLIIRAADNVG
jgi:hypothetical protein